jgi:carbon storage regulator
MLVLSRKEGQSIVIPSLGIQLVFIRCKDGQCRVGIEAPREVSVYRNEVLEAMRDRKDGPASPGPISRMGQPDSFPGALTTGQAVKP